jgi:hypothetical protein
MGISYIKDAKFVPESLAERWPAAQRRVLTAYAKEAGAIPLVSLSEAVVEVGVYDAPAGTALLLANFTYAPVKSLRMEVPTRMEISSVQSLAHGALAFETVAAPNPWRDEGDTYVQRFSMPLADDDLVLLETTR